MPIIITSPHATCPVNTTERMCDIVASLSADILYKQTIESKIPSVYIPGNEYRYNHDLNRKESRHTKYRKLLDKVFKINKDNNSLVVDVHSFPNYRIEEAGDINFFKQGETPPDLVLLKGPKDLFKGKSLCETLSENLKKHTGKCITVKGLKVLDILNQASDNKIPGILIEINEKYVDDKEELIKIIREIVNVIVRIN